MTAERLMADASDVFWTGNHVQSKMERLSTVGGRLRVEAAA